MDTGASGFPRGDLRVSDAERDRALAELTEHFQAGRLTKDEFDERSGQALRARTGNDLSVLFGDLPRQPSVPQPRPTALGPSVRPNVGARPVLRVVIPLVILAIIAGNLFGALHDHATVGWVAPVVIIGLIFLRLAARRR